MTVKSLSNMTGIIEVSKIDELNVSKDNFYKYVKDNNYEKVGPGMYADKETIVDELLVLHKRCPNGVISHDEALYYYGLIDREPLSHTITVYSGFNASRLIKSGYTVYYVNKELLNLGKINVVDNFGNEIPMYDLQRTIIDLIRNRNKFEIQDFTTALKTYAKRSDKDLSKLYEYAKAFRVDKVLRTYMEVLL
ncbi:MAG: abortive phage infection protein [Erysipelotrichaceae bacterium]|nr:abortive phage infection protein [Erysipelotrichaceae bacterium]